MKIDVGILTHEYENKSILVVVVKIKLKVNKKAPRGSFLNYSFTPLFLAFSFTKDSQLLALRLVDLSFLASWI